MHHDDENARWIDIAQALELGFETAKSRLRYAMNKLRTCMGAHPVLMPAAQSMTSLR